MPNRGEDDANLTRSLVLRVLAAAVLVAAFFLAKGHLGARNLVAARFGIGVALFALLVDAGRRLVGKAPPVQGDLSMHKQKADPLMDDRYERVHEPVKRFIEEGVWTRSYQAVLEDAFRAYGIPEGRKDAAFHRAQQAARPERPKGEPLTGTLIAGGIIAFGSAWLVGALLDALGLPVFGPVLLILGLGLGLLQLRAHDAGGRWWGLLVGLTGAAVVIVGSFQMTNRYAGPWWILSGVGLLMAMVSVGLTLRHASHPPPWSRLASLLRERLTRLRRAFFLLLVLGGLIFPFRGVIEEAFAVAGWSFSTPYQLLTIGYATVASYVVVELLSTWYGLHRGREKAKRFYEERVRTNEALLDLLDAHRAPSGEDAG